MYWCPFHRRPQDLVPEDNIKRFLGDDTCLFCVACVGGYDRSESPDAEEGNETEHILNILSRLGHTGSHAASTACMNPIE